MMSISTISIPSSAGQLVERLLAIFGVDDLHLVLLEDGGDGKQVPPVVVDQQHLLAHERRIVSVSRRSISRFGGGRFDSTR